MVKMHTRVKRSKSLTSGLRHSLAKKVKVVGPRTFRTLEAAKAYMAEHKLKGVLVPAKKGKRFRIDQS